MYPVENKQIEMNCIDNMIDRYPTINIGYAGHEDPRNNVVTQMAIDKGATILERHVGHATDSISLNAYSTEIDRIEDRIEAIMAAWDICEEKGKKNISEAEIISMNELARGCYCAKLIFKGKIITREHIYFAMPCANGQTTSGQYQENMVAMRDYQIDEPICEEVSINVIQKARNIIHEVKGMLHEANVIMGNEFEIELSHHYGLERFRDYGATIVNIINRAYCKKIIVMLSGQKNPMHFHKVKEETFQVLSGVLQLQIEGNQGIQLRAGMVFLVERFVKHAFSSETGCIFEEISTMHIKNDSFYDDPLIAKLDPMERKTVLRDW